ncbi:hypothetical protein VTI74DRAFT_3509 [Chaetomium olivicolor]
MPMRACGGGPHLWPLSWVSSWGLLGKMTRDIIVALRWPQGRSMARTFLNLHVHDREGSEFKATQAICPFHSSPVAMTDTLPRSLPRSLRRPLHSVLPPMPRRQSCDRCHEQKVRCVTEGPNGTLGPGGITEASEADPQGPVVSSVPCVRCRKAGAVCIYSPQLRSGRPRLRRDSSAPPPRKRARRVSRCSSSSPLSPMLSHSMTPPPSSRPSTAVTFSSSGVGLGILEQPDEHIQAESSPPIPSPLPPPPVATPQCDEMKPARPGPEVASLSEPWLTSLFDSDGSQFLAGMDQLSSISHYQPAPTISSVPLFPGLATEVSTTGSGMSSFPWSYPNPPDYSLEELSQISLRIHLAGRALETLSRTPVSAPSPVTNDVFDVACSLVNFVERYASQRPLPVSKPPDHPKCTPVPGCLENYSAGSFGASCPGASPVIDTALDSSINLMIHACHQALLGIFEDLTASSFFQLVETQQPTPPGTPPAASFHSQEHPALVMANLISHHLDELDRAVSKLSKNPVAVYRQDWPDRRGQGEFSEAYEPPDLHFGGHTTWQGCLSLPLFKDMEQRWLRVRHQVRAAERLFGQPNVM